MGVAREFDSALDRSTIAERSGALRPLGFQVPGLTILWHPDLGRVGERVALTALGSGQRIALSRREPLFNQPGRSGARPLADGYLSRSPVWLEPGTIAGAIRLRVETGSNPRLSIAGDELREPREIAAEEIATGIVLLLADRVALLLHRFTPLDASFGEGRSGSLGLEGASDAILEVRQKIAAVADLELPVLLLGETGTGKELAARAIHKTSSRRRGPFIAVNLGAIPPALAAAELFGASRGAFTGADQRREGYFQRADGGTLFLDEIAEAPLEVQVSLLRALESREVQPVGADTPARVNVRILAATDADLTAAVTAGRFRVPLLHRLNSYPITLPPLRRRRDDIGRLTLLFLHQELAAVGEAARLETDPATHPWMPTSTLARWASYDWPGNVRQLHHAVQRVVLASRGETRAVMPRELEAELAPPGRLAATTLPAAAPRPAAPIYRRRGDVGEGELLAALAAHHWRIAPTALALGVSRTALYALIDACGGVRKASDLSREEIESALARAGGEMTALVESLRVSPRGLRLRMTALGMR